MKSFTLTGNGKQASPRFLYYTALKKLLIYFSRTKEIKLKINLCYRFIGVSTGWIYNRNTYLSYFIEIFFKLLSENLFQKKNFNSQIYFFYKSTNFVSLSVAPWEMGFLKSLGEELLFIIRGHVHMDGAVKWQC